LNGIGRTWLEKTDKAQLCRVSISGTRRTAREQQKIDTHAARIGAAAVRGLAHTAAAPNAF